MSAQQDGTPDKPDKLDVDIQSAPPDDKNDNNEKAPSPASPHVSFAQAMVTEIRSANSESSDAISGSRPVTDDTVRPMSIREDAITSMHSSSNPYGLSVHANATPYHTAQPPEPRSVRNHVLSPRGLTPHSQTIRSLQYLQSIRVREEMPPSQQPQLQLRDRHLSVHSFVARTRFNTHRSRIAHSPNTILEDETPIVDEGLDEFECEEEQAHQAVSPWTLQFKSRSREQQYRIFVSTRYGTAIRVSILALIVAYILLAVINARFVRQTVQAVLICAGLLVMLVVFVVAACFSGSSSSLTDSYLMALFHDEMEGAGAGDAGDKTEATKPAKKRTSGIAANDPALITPQTPPHNHTNGKPSHDNNALQRQCRQYFQLYSSRMMSLCVVSLLLLLIIDNRFALLCNDEFLVYYLLSSLVTSTFSVLDYYLFSVCAWSLYLLWIAIAAIQTAMHVTLACDSVSFDIYGIALVLLLSNLVLSHQVKKSDMARRKHFLRAMNYVRDLHLKQSSSTVTSATPAAPPMIQRSNTTGFDLMSVASIQQLTAALDSVVDKQATDVDDTSVAVANSPYTLHKTPQTQTKRSSALMREVRTEFGMQYSTETSKAREFGHRMGLTKKRESNALGFFNVLRGLGGNLVHYHGEEDSHDGDDDDDYEDEDGYATSLYLSQQTVELEPQSTNSMASSSRKASSEAKLKDRNMRKQNSMEELQPPSPLAELEQQEEVPLPTSSAQILKTIDSEKSLHAQEQEQNVYAGDEEKEHKMCDVNLFRDSVRNQNPRCVSIHELPSWYSKSAVSPYVLSGYRIHYNLKLAMRSMFEAHNETSNIWTEFLPALALLALVVYFNVDSQHFWVRSQDPFTKSVLFICMPLIVARPVVSGFAHTLTCIDKKSSKMWWRLDFFSIVVAAAAGSIVWTRCVFWCDNNLQILYMFCCGALSFSTTITALTTKNAIIRDVSLGAFFIFALIFLYIFEVYIYVSGQASLQRFIVDGQTLFFWTLSVGCTFSAMLFRATKFPESLLVKRKFKQLMKRVYEERFAHDGGGGSGRDDAKRQKMTFDRLLQNVQTFTAQTEEKLARIENLQTTLNYENETGREFAAAGDEMIKQRRKDFMQEIDDLENEIVRQIKNEMQIEQCMESAYVSLIAESGKAWFNYVFTSHNFWHIFMNLAVVFSVIAWKQYFSWRATAKDDGHLCPL